MKDRTSILGAAGLACAVLACTPAPPPKMSSSMASADQAASCPKESSVVGGGYEVTPEARRAGKIPIVVVNRPTETGWIVQCVEPDGQTSTACKAFVLCATVLH